MLGALCICALIPRLQTRTRLLLLLHYREERKPTNTGQLAALCLVNSRVIVTGDRSRPLPPGLFGHDQRAVFLYPAVDAVPLERVVADGEPITLVVPDGSWRQAGKMRARVDGLADVPCAFLPEGPGTTYRLRAERRPGGLATMEAIARAMLVLETAQTAEQMLHVFRVMVERTLWSRGSMNARDVTGGIPVEALDQFQANHKQTGHTQS